MDIFIPKIKEVFMNHDSVIRGPMNSVNCRFKAVLRGPDGRIKQENPWQDNLITNYGTSRLREGDYLYYLHIGSGTTPPAYTDVNLETYLGQDNGSSAYPIGSSGAPDYIRYCTRSFTFAPGNGTGLISEIGGSNTSQGGANQLCTHALLDTPINKGASDELTITYQIFYRCDLNDVTGTVNISGEDFWYVCRVQNVDIGPTAVHLPTFGWIGNLPYRNEYYQSGIGATITDYPIGTAFGDPIFGVSEWNGGGLGGYYSEIAPQWGVDNSNNQTFKSYWGRAQWGNDIQGAVSNSPGWGFEIGRVADGPLGLADSGIFKEDTHVMGINVRMYSDRYVP